MIFEYIKNLFWKADATVKKRKAMESDSELNLCKENLKKQCSEEFKNTKNSKIITITKSWMSDDFDFSTNVRQQLKEDVTGIKQKQCTLDHDKSIKDFPGSTLNMSYQLFEKRKYEKMLRNYSVNQKSHKYPTSEVSIHRSNKHQRSQQSRDSLTPVFPLKANFSRICDWDIFNLQKKNFLLACNSLNKTPANSSTENSVNSLAKMVSLRKVMDQEFLPKIIVKHDLRVNQHKEDAKKLEKYTESLTRQNLLSREVALEDYLNRSMRFCEEVLEDIEKPVLALPELTKDMMNEVFNAIHGCDNDIVSEGFGLSIRKKDIKTLSGLNWLNDEIINFYMNLLIERGKNTNYPSVHAMNTFFYPKLLCGGHASLRRWTRKVDIFSQDLIIIPIHLGIHWCMSVIDFRNKSIQYYDSMGSANQQCLMALQQYLHDEHLDKKKSVFSTSDWILECVKDIPQQMNGSDCGVFSCVFAEYICAQKSFSFSQQNMPYFRSKMIYEILKRQLL